MKNLFLGTLLLAGICASAQEDKKTVEQTQITTTATTPEVIKEQAQIQSTSVVESADNGTATTTNKTEVITTGTAVEADKNKRAVLASEQ